MHYGILSIDASEAGRGKTRQGLEARDIHPVNSLTAPANPSSGGSAQRMALPTIQLKGGRPRTVVAYHMMLRLPALHAPIALDRGLVVRPGWMVLQQDGFASNGARSR